MKAHQKATPQYKPSAFRDLWNRPELVKRLSAAEMYYSHHYGETGLVRLLREAIEALENAEKKEQGEKA